MSGRGIARAGFALLLALAACSQAPAPGVEGPFVRVDGDPIDPRRSGRVTALIFITTDCPIANGYAPQIRALIASFAERPVDIHLVHVDPALTPERARAHAAEYGYKGSILLDPEHRLVAWSGATITPEAVVLDGSGVVRYRGRINNWYGDIGRKRVHVSKHELREALEAVLAGREVSQPRTEAVGCVIEPLR